MNVTGRLAAVVVTIVAPIALVTAASPGMGYAQECGLGTVFDPVSNTCVAAQPPAPPPPPPPLPAVGDLTPGFSVGVCVPIPVPFAPSVCFGV